MPDEVIAALGNTAAALALPLFSFQHIVFFRRDVKFSCCLSSNNS